MRFILLDRITALEPGVRICAEKTFPGEEPLFADHFPGFPVVPGVLLTECMAQAGGWLARASRAEPGKLFLAMVDRARFRHWVRPEQTIVIEARLRTAQARSAAVDASVTVDGCCAATARITYAAPSASALDAQVLEAWSQSTFEKLGGPAALGGAHACGG